MAENWHETRDLVVVGSGAGGMTAALAGHDAGCDTVVLERGEHFGGTSSMSGGSLWIPANPLVGAADDLHAAWRYLRAATRGEIAEGPYGEEVQPGNDLLYRFLLEASMRVTGNLRAGGLLRVSNEPEEVLDFGPEYLGSPWGIDPCARDQRSTRAPGSVRASARDAAGSIRELGDQARRWGVRDGERRAHGSSVRRRGRERSGQLCISCGAVGGRASQADVRRTSVRSSDDTARTSRWRLAP